MRMDRSQSRGIGVPPGLAPVLPLRGCAEQRVTKGPQDWTRCRGNAAVHWSGSLLGAVAFGDPEVGGDHSDVTVSSAHRGN